MDPILKMWYRCHEVVSQSRCPDPRSSAEAPGMRFAIDSHCYQTFVNPDIVDIAGRAAVIGQPPSAAAQLLLLDYRAGDSMPLAQYWVTSALPQPKEGQCATK